MAQAQRQTLWEATKQEAQSAFNQIGTAYQDIMVHGRLMAHGSGMERQNAMNLQIAEAAYNPTPEDWQEYGQYVDQYNAQHPEQGELFYRNHFHGLDGHEPSEPPFEPEM
jgi:hypothetical protein